MGSGASRVIRGELCEGSGREEEQRPLGPQRSPEKVQADGQSPHCAGQTRANTDPCHVWSVARVAWGTHGLNVRTRDLRSALLP